MDYKLIIMVLSVVLDIEFYVIVSILLNWCLEDKCKE